MFSGARIEGEIALMPLLKGMLDARLVLEKPDLLLEMDADGRGNWQMGSSEEKGEHEEKISVDKQGGFSLRPFIRELRLEQVKVAYVDARADQQQTIDFDTILIGSQGEKVAVELNGRFNDLPVALTWGVVSKAPSVEGAPAGFDLAGNIGDVVLHANGTLEAISATADMDLVVKAEAPSLKVLSPFSGRDLPDQGPWSPA